MTISPGSDLLGGERPPQHFGYRAGQHYNLFGTTSSTTVAFAGADKLVLTPFRIEEPITISALFGRVVTAGAGSSAKIGIWRHDPVTLRPTGLPITVDNAGQTTQAANQLRTFGVATVTLQPGWYWVGIVATGTMPAWSSMISTDTNFVRLVGSPTAINSVTAIYQALSTAFTYSGDLAAFDVTNATWAFEAGPGFPLIAALAA